MHELLQLQILYVVREHFSPITLFQLHNEVKEFVESNLNIFTSLDLMHPLTSLSDLCREGFLQITTDRQIDITSRVQNRSRNEIYHMVQASEKINNRYYVQITDKLAQMQELFGFNLSESIAHKMGYRPLSIIPTIFKQPNHSLVSDIFVIMPFQNNFNYLYQDSIQKVCKHINVTCMRADDIYSSDAIIDDIWSLIHNSKVIIADCTGKNPNVMYELGIAHALGKNVVLITQNINDIPFDLRHLRHMHYEYTPHAIKQFEINLEKALIQYFK